MRLLDLFLSLGLLAILLATSGCEPGSGRSADLKDRQKGATEKKGPFRVAVSLSPHAWITSAIGGDLLVVEPLLPAGDSPETWNPDDQALAVLARADLIVINGGMLEKWSQRVSLPFSTLDLSRTIRSHWLEYPGVVTHSHGPEGERSYEGTDGHFWLDPDLLLKQGEAILARLIQMLPTEESRLVAQWNPVKERIEDWATRWKSLSLEEEKSIWVTEPSWGYLMDRLSQTMKVVSPADSFEWLSELDGESSGFLLWRETPPDSWQQQIEKARFQNVVWSPAESLGLEYSRYPELQEKGLQSLENALQSQP